LPKSGLAGESKLTTPFGKKSHPGFAYFSLRFMLFFRNSHDANLLHCPFSVAVKQERSLPLSAVQSA
jgi:hypothetical protein